MRHTKAIQIIIFGFIFIISLILWNYMLVGRYNHGVRETTQATLPLLVLISDEQEINQLHGYQGDVDASMLRDSTTPLDKNSLKVSISGNKEGIEAVTYKIYDSDNKTILDRGDAAFQKEGDQSLADINISKRLESGRTYLMELSVTKDNKDVKYYTRVVYGTGFHLKECMEFAMKFHDSTLKEGNTEFISQYLETEEGTISNNLSYVDLKSSQEAICYANLSPQVERMYPATIKEISQNVTSMEFRYILSAENSEGVKQYYQANEYFRVRYSKDRMYLLNYERKLESYMRYDTIDRVNNRILIGIGGSDKQLISKDNGKKAAFVVQNELWYYDYQNSDMYKVFSFMGEDYRESRNNYPKHGIQVMQMKSNGDISFLVYGYMNRGKHEGKNGISVYRFYAEEQKIEELAFIPVKVQYDTMKNDLEKGAFLSKNNQFYFYLDSSIYHVDLDKEQSSILAQNITDDLAVVSENGMLALNQSKNKIKVVNLSSGKEWIISGEKGQLLKPIGFIQKDFVYGTCEEDQIVRQKDGTYMYPLNKVFIRSDNKNVNEYGENGSYITDAKIDGTTVVLTYSKKNGNSYKKTDSSYIRFKNKTEDKVVFEYGYTGTRLNQLYLSFPENIYIQTRPSYLSTNVEEKDDELKIDFANNVYKYKDAYVYTGGKLSGTYSSMKDAIKEAKQGGGVVVNYGQLYLWEKGIAKSYGKVANISITKAKNKSETDVACIKMMADSEGKDLSYDKIKKLKGNTFDKLFNAFDKQGVNYSDCNLEDVLYSISKGRSVMARRKNGTYVLLISYNQTKLRYFDPLTGESVQAERSAMEKEFKAAGNIFYSYAK
ncbi:hypothetical protein [Anaerostipes sp.]|uniref:hypothetical protein n=1 Tax=Anaerostipes sp. TaxID=1872530 RepID=UPI002587D8CA|nr:hypothetical protein [Anaerostipes sp.]MCI5622857.1 hypothetical protein [Anaerostipes sp.]